MKFTARSRLETYASLSRTQSDEETYGLRMEPAALAAGDSVGAGGDGPRSADMVAVEHATRPGRMEMTDPTDVIERAQAWLAAADERGINRTDRDGYLAVIEDLVAEVEFQRTALQGYRNRQLELTDKLAAYERAIFAYKELRSEVEEWDCDGLSGCASWGWWHAVDDAVEKLDEPVPAPQPPAERESIHSCSYYCTRPECIKAQRDELRDRFVDQQSDKDIVLPPLPEKRRRFFCTKCGSSECTPDTVKDKHPLCVCGYLGFGEDCDYNDDEMRDYGRACRAAALEECAQIAEDMDFDPSQSIAAIRALKEKL